jgi:hypothetical protein
MTKLKNIQALRQMLDGTHRSQTKTTIGLTDASKVGSENQKREVGEKWTDENGVTWIQKDGYRINATKFLSDVKEYLAPKECPKCSKMMTSQVDKKMYMVNKMCLDCTIDFEHQLKIEGKYEEYERNRIRQNAEEWLKRAEADKDALIQVITEQATYANSDGSVEKWTGGLTVDQMKEQIEEQFRVFKEDFLAKL